ncbi:flagellar hook-length control protein FliK [Phenylobacterium sp.]|uniref:flagellar hook-length control protein FliK n=1 Tax=Phenylobacterium sp. TaxID=1871053 RepID=UPI0035AF5996
MAIAPIQGVSTTLFTLPVTPVRAVTPALRTDVEAKAAEAQQAVEPAPVEIHAKAVAEAVQSAAPRQTALGPLFADLGQALKVRGLPPQVLAAATRLMTQAAPLGPDVDGATIARTFLQSGLFLERNLAERPNASPAGRDLKADLLTLKQALSNWLGGGDHAPAARTAAAPPPPYRGGPTTAQAPASAALTADASPAQAGHRLAEDVEGALARHELLQAASLPPADPHAEDAQTTRWMFEIPFTTPQGASVAQFEISRDDEGHVGREGEREPVYRARFSIDLEPLGPMHAQVALSGEHAGVTLWAERPASVEVLRLGRPLLAQALSDAALDAEVNVYAGAPPRAAAGPGRFMDQSA